MATNEKRLGTTSELIAASYMSEKGYDIFFPVSLATKADFIVQGDSRPLAVQVKSAYLSKMHEGYQYLQVRTDNAKYGPEDFDIYLAVLRSDGRVWDIPKEYIFKYKTIYLNPGYRRQAKYNPDEWLVKCGSFRRGSESIRTRHVSE